MIEKKAAEPSYAMAATGGFFLGILGAALLLFFAEVPWIAASVPVVAAIAGILGAYVAAEPYDDLREKYDGLLNKRTGDDKSDEKLQVLRDRLGREATRLAQEAAELGEDGLKIAEAAEILRKEAAALYAETPGKTPEG